MVTMLFCKYISRYCMILVNNVNTPVLLMDNDNSPVGVNDNIILPGNDSNTLVIDA